MITRVETALELIGNTPIIRINRINKNKNVNIYAKLEGFNPSGSIKDRIVLQMIEEAEKTGELTRDKTIIEPTSGNTGIGLAMVAAIKGYKVKIVMSEAVSIERRKMITAFGAELELTSKDEGTDGAIRKTEEIVRENPWKYYFPNQFKNKYNPAAHYKNTAREIIQQLRGEIDVFVAAIGTSGTLMGISKYLKQHNKDIRIVSAEPTLGHKIQGMKSMEEAIKPDIFEESMLDERVIVKDEESFEMTRRLAREEGLFVGMSSGAALAVAVKQAEKMEKGNIVLIFPDRGEKYLSTDLF